MSFEGAGQSRAVTIKNPVLAGFNPDPSMIRVGDTYYLATSTFEWFPGVRIHASRDLVHWNLVADVLDDHREYESKRQQAAALAAKGDPESMLAAANILAEL